MEPNWTPLENKLGRTRCVGFMFMGRVNGINHYKHGITRTSLYLDDEANCYVKVEERYVPANWEAELGKLEACLLRLGATLATLYDDEFIARKRKALLSQGISLLTVEVDPQDIKIH